MDLKKGDARRGELLAAAEKLFYTKGYENTSVQDILDAVGFSKGGFYHHFDSKLAAFGVCFPDNGLGTSQTVSYKVNTVFETGLDDLLSEEEDEE